MSWAIGFDTKWQRDIGYGVPAYCDHPGCEEKIDRGLSHVCGLEPYGGDRGCGLYFCIKHLAYHRFLDADAGSSFCKRCIAAKSPYKPKPDHPEWLKHKATDPSWAEWRKQNSGDPQTTDAAKIQKGGGASDD